MARTLEAGHGIPLHMHRRGQLLHAVSGIMRVETAEAAWIVPPARALWLPPQWPHSVTMRSHVEMRTIYIDPSACAGLPQQPVLVEISGLLRELILALLEEPVDFAEAGRGGTIALLILTELARGRFVFARVKPAAARSCGRWPGAPVGRRLSGGNRRLGRLRQSERLLRHDPPHHGQRPPPPDQAAGPCLTAAQLVLLDSNL